MTIEIATLIVLMMIAFILAALGDLVREIRTLLKDIKASADHGASCTAEILNLQQARHLDGR